MMPTTDAEMVVALYATEDSVIAQASYLGDSRTALVGAIDEEPFEYLTTTVTWLREQSLADGTAGRARLHYATASQLLASELGDSDAEREARSIADTV